MLGLVHGSIDIDPKHPIFNFLFQYYSFDHNLLLRWSPGMHARCTGVSTAREPDLWTGRGWEWSSVSDGSGGMAPELCKPSLRKAARNAAEVMRRSQSRVPHLNCYGLHEWAMLYHPQTSTLHPRRHQSLPLRLSQADLNTVVETQPIACSHFDAFRFFMPEAAPLNTIANVTRDSVLENEQPGCVHATMDLFRYSLKLWPWLPAELLADALELAIAARVLDMRASPYDLSEYHTHAPSAEPTGGQAGAVAGVAAGRGVEAGGGGGGGIGEEAGFDLSPVCVDTPEGRKQYQRMQADLARRAVPIRARLLREYEEVIAAWDEDEAA